MRYDIILCGVLILSFVIGWSRGFFRTLWGLIALVLTIVLTSIIQPYAVDMFKNAGVSNKLESYIHTNVEQRIDETYQNQLAAENIQNTDNSDPLYSLPQNFALQAQDAVKNSAEQTALSIADTVSDKVLEIACAIISFMLIRLVLGFVYHIISAIFKLPILKQSNKIAGALVQVVISLAVIYTIFAGAAVIGSDFTKDTVLCSYMYNNNLLLNLIMR